MPQDLRVRQGFREFFVGGDEDLTQQIVKEIVRQALE